MTRRQQLSDAQIAVMFDPPTEQHELVRYYTLTGGDLSAISRCRGDHNRLDYAVMLCYLRHPGRPLHPGERPPEALLTFVAEQLDVLPTGGYIWDATRNGSENTDGLRPLRPAPEPARKAA